MTRSCKSVRPWIARSVDGDLEPGEALSLAAHIEACTACKIVLAHEARLSALLAEERDACELDASFFRAVMASLPERPALHAGRVSRKARWRRGLRLAAWAGLLATGLGVLTHVVPTLRWDLPAPLVPRFTSEETDGWLAVLGSAVQWLCVTVQSVGWSRPEPGAIAVTVGALSASAGVTAAAGLLAISGALAWAARGRSNPS